MAIEPSTTVSVGTIVFIALNVLAFWYREWRKHRTWRSNGDDLKEIKTDMKGVKKAQGEAAVELGKVGEAVESQKEQCAMTVARFDNAISDQGKELLKIARGK